MEQLVESTPDDLWPFGTDKRMLYAIYAHFNTMINQQSKLLHLPSPVQQKLKTICRDIKSLIQIITGMTKLSKDNLEFELSEIYKEINGSYPQRHRGSYTLDNESDDHNPPKCTSKIIHHKSPKKRKKKKKRKRKKSQSVLIYDFEGCSPSEPSVSEPELNPIIIEDYRSDASINSDASACSDITQKNLIPKNYKTHFSRHRSLTYQIQHNNETIIRHRPKPNPPNKNILLEKHKGWHGSKSISPEIKSTSAPPPIQFDFVNSNCSDSQPYISSFITSSFASSVSSIMQNNNLNISNSFKGMNDKQIENERIFALESQSESETENNKTKTRNKNVKKAPPKAPSRKQTLPPKRRNTAPYMYALGNISNNKNNNKHCKSKSVTNIGYMPNLSQLFDSENEIQSSENECTPKPPLKSHKIVATKVVNKSWKQRKNRPLPTKPK